MHRCVTTLFPILVECKQSTVHCIMEFFGSSRTLDSFDFCSGFNSIKPNLLSIFSSVFHSETGCPLSTGPLDSVQAPQLTVGLVRSPNLQSTIYRRRCSNAPVSPAGCSTTHSLSPKNLFSIRAVKKQLL